MQRATHGHKEDEDWEGREGEVGGESLRPQHAFNRELRHSFGADLAKRRAESCEEAAFRHSVCGEGMKMRLREGGGAEELREGEHDGTAVEILFGGGVCRNENETATNELPCIAPMLHFGLLRPVDARL